MLTFNPRTYRRNNTVQSSRKFYMDLTTI